MDAGVTKNVVQIVGPGVTTVALVIKWVDDTIVEPEPTTVSSGDVLLEHTCVKLVNAEFSANCDGTTNVKLINGTIEEVIFKVNDVDHPVVPGFETIPNVPASAGGDIQVTVDTLLVGSYRYVKPDLCTPTGTDVTGTIGIGALLLDAGVAIVFVSVSLRRRRVRT